LSTTTNKQSTDCQASLLCVSLRWSIARSLEWVGLNFDWNGIDWLTQTAHHQCIVSLALDTPHPPGTSSTTTTTMAAARCARRTLVALALLLAFLLLVDPASGLFGFGKKKKETDEAAAKAGLEESLAAAELSRKKKDSKKAAEPPKKPKPAAAVSARKVRLASWMGRTCVWLCEERCCCPMFVVSLSSISTLRMLVWGVGPQHLLWPARTPELYNGRKNQPTGARAGRLPPSMAACPIPTAPYLSSFSWSIYLGSPPDIHQNKTWS